MPKPTRSYRYSFGNWFTKSILWILFTLLVVTWLFDLLTVASNLLNGVFSTGDLLRVVAAVVVALLFIAYASNLYPDVDVVEDGVLVQFFWRRLFVPWEKIDDVKAGGSFGFKTWVVTTTGLTALHRLYGLMYLRTLKPAFLIFSNLERAEQLVHDITRHIK